MYMYYFLGFKLYEDKDFQLKQEKEKDNIAANTYILALDGDVDFLPDAVIKVTDMLGYVAFMKLQKTVYFRKELQHRISLWQNSPNWKWFHSCLPKI